MNDKNKNKKTCSICLNTLASNTNMTTRFSCGHAFHERCYTDLEPIRTPTTTTKRNVSDVSSSHIRSDESRIETKGGERVGRRQSQTNTPLSKNWPNCMNI